MRVLVLISDVSDGQNKALQNKWRSLYVVNPLPTDPVALLEHFQLFHHFICNFAQRGVARLADLLEFVRQNKCTHSTPAMKVLKPVEDHFWRSRQQNTILTPPPFHRTPYLL